MHESYSLSKFAEQENSRISKKTKPNARNRRDLRFSIISFPLAAQQSQTPSSPSVGGDLTVDSKTTVKVFRKYV
jgi:hypothetical protein